MDTRDYHHQIINSLTSGVIAVDKDGSIIVANPAACAHLNVPEDALAPGRRLEENDLTQPLAEILREVAETRSPMSRRSSGPRSSPC